MASTGSRDLACASVSCAPPGLVGAASGNVREASIAKPASSNDNFACSGRISAASSSMGGPVSNNIASFADNSSLKAVSARQREPPGLSFVGQGCLSHDAGSATDNAASRSVCFRNQTQFCFRPAKLASLKAVYRGKAQRQRAPSLC
jgi:hypothetical protein